LAWLNLFYGISETLSHITPEPSLHDAGYGCPVPDTLMNGHGCNLRYPVSDIPYTLTADAMHRFNIHDLGPPGQPSDFKFINE